MKRGAMIVVGKLASCHECCFESSGKYAERDARRHANATGHIPTLEVGYDIHPAAIAALADHDAGVK